MDDVIVVGGRCAGAPTAMLLARAGLKVRVVERSARLADVLSGPVIRPAGTARLRAWGLLDAVMASGCPPVTAGTLWLDGERVVPGGTATEGEDEPADGAPPPAAAPRRGVLDPLLLDAAREAGAAVELGNSVRGLLRDGDRVTGVSTDRGDYQARLVIGADGRHSRIARLVGAPKYVDTAPATYAYYTYWKGVDTGQSHAFVNRDHFIGMYPSNDDLTLVFFQAPHAGFDQARLAPAENYHAILRSQPAAMEVLANAEPAEPVRGTGDLPMFFRVSAGPGWALAGDAGHHKDPFIARGITDAFRDAELIADAVTGGWDGDLDRAVSAYPARRDACARPVSSANDTIASALGAVPPVLLTQAIAAANMIEGALDQPGTPS
jgi:2-polyprenyl-6-methoxyphenol hydroxylase-like FAD-dependent oxidoreductase